MALSFSLLLVTMVTTFADDFLLFFDVLLLSAFCCQDLLTEGGSNKVGYMFRGELSSTDWFLGLFKGED